MCKPDLIVAVRLEIVGKAECEIRARSLSGGVAIHQISVFGLIARIRGMVAARDLVLPIINVLAAAEPADAFGVVSPL